MMSIPPSGKIVCPLCEGFSVVRTYVQVGSCLCPGTGYVPERVAQQMQAD